MTQINFDWINKQFAQMVSHLEEWTNINTHSQNHLGCSNLMQKLAIEFAKLEPDEMHFHFFNETPLLFLQKRTHAPLQVFFGGHIDTVFPSNHPFQKVTYLEDNILQGPGITDMKGGIVILLKSLEAWEKTENALKLGWKIILNADEEIGSPTSSSFIELQAKLCHFALLFEPLMPNGAFVAERKGSSTYRVISQGKAAHAGRNPTFGKNAIVPLTKLLCALEKISFPKESWINIGTIQGGTAANVIPAHAECLINFRARHLSAMKEFEENLQALANQEKLALKKVSFTVPKIATPKTKEFFEQLQACGKMLGRDLAWEESGGVSDGNRIAALGIPTIDTLGALGNYIHTEQEYIQLDSLIMQTKLTALLLEKLANGR